MTPEQLEAKGLRVKELVWSSEKSDYFDCTEHAECGMYQITEEWADEFYLFVGGECYGEPHPTIGAAKDAGNKHNRARVLASLVEVG